MPYFIDSLDTLDFEFDVDEFADQLRARWQSVREDTFDQSGLFAGCWLVDFGSTGHLMITLHKDQKSVSIDDADVYSIAQFALWYRKLIPVHYSLYLYHDSWGDELVEISPSNTETEIADALADL